MSCRALDDRLRIEVSDTAPASGPSSWACCSRRSSASAPSTPTSTGPGSAWRCRAAWPRPWAGQLGVDSAVGAGSTFWVELPYAEAPVDRSARLEERHQLEPPVEEVPPERRQRLLYIEDNLSNLRLVERLLTRRPDVELVAAMQGRLGLDLARQHRPVMVLLDLHLPDVDGAEVLRQLRDDPATASIPVVIVSADATPGQIQRLLGAGARAFLPKPVEVPGCCASSTRSSARNRPPDAAPPRPPRRTGQSGDVAAEPQQERPRAVAGSEAAGRGLRRDRVGRLTGSRRVGRRTQSDASTSPISAAVWNVISSRTASGTSSRSGPLRNGTMTSVRPARWAASTFCLTPPIGRTLPCRVTSPVMPTVERTGRPVSSETSAVVIVTPADGPSLGTAPAGTCRWNRVPSNAVGVDAELLGVRAHVRQRDRRRLLHDVAQLTGEGQALTGPGSARHRGGLDEQDVAAHAGDGQAGRHARDRRALGRLEEELRPAQPAPHALGVVDHDGRRALAARDRRGDLAQQLAQLPLEVPDPGLTGVVGDDDLQRVLGDGDLGGVQPVALQLAAPAGGRGRWPPSRPRCSRRAARSPCGRAAARGPCR